MKIMTILGTRPEIIRLSRIIPELDKLCEHVLVHTGQNYDHNLNEIFFKELGIRTPNYNLECKSVSMMEQIGKILVQCEKVMIQERPDRLLILGDTNSALSAMVAKRIGIPVYHMEAGNRCFDDRVPEEVNRRIIDQCSDILLPYTERSRTNLLREGIESKCIFVTGNPIKEVLDHYSPQIETSDVLNRLNLQAGKYILITLHRAENVDFHERLIRFVNAFQKLHSDLEIPIICSLHPRTRSQLEKHSLILESKGVRVMDPFGLFDFVKLEKFAKCVLTDSGTVQEECCIFNIPTITLRDVTERPETVEVGSNILSGADPESILNCVKVSLTQKQKWDPPREYMIDNISLTVVKIILGYLH